MSKKRIKAESFSSRLDFEVAVDRATWIENELRRLKAEQAAAVQEAQKTHATQIAELSAELKTKAALCEKYATDHRAELLTDEAKAKSVETPHSRYGFRTGMHTLKTLSKKTWEMVLDALTENHLVDHIRYKPEVNKETILAAWKAGLPLVASHEGEDIEFSLSDVGVKVVQDETFFMEGKVDGAEAVKAGAA